jgi:hypothetical protein
LLQPHCEEIEDEGEDGDDVWVDIDREEDFGYSRLPVTDAVLNVHNFIGIYDLVNVIHGPINWCYNSFK